MMIEYIEGDIFESPAQVIVNTVNTVGVMGKGLALSFKQRYPDMFESYRMACEKNQFTMGKLMLYQEADHWILLFPTKENWRNPSKLEYIEKGLKKFVSSYEDKHISSIAFPKLGCGNGELNWADVKPLMEKYLKKLPIDVYIYLGFNNFNKPEHKEPLKTIKWLKENAKDMSFNGVVDDLKMIGPLMPYEFMYKGQIYTFSYNNGVVIKNETEDYFIPEDQFYENWDNIRELSVFKIPEEEKIELLYALLFSLGYLSRVKIMDSKAKDMYDGYQINEGLGRAYATREFEYEV